MASAPTHGVSPALATTPQFQVSRIAGGLAPSAVTIVSPTGLDRGADRALGALTVTITFAGIVRAPNPRSPLPRRLQRTRIISFQTATITPSGQTHTRAQGSPLANPTLTTSGLDRTATRALGSPTATFLLPVPQVLRVVQPKLAGRTVASSQILSGLQPTIAVSPAPASLDRTRALGSPLVNPTATPAGQAHTRAVGSPLANPTLAPTGQAHTRAQGDPSLTAVFATPTVIRVVQPRLAGRTVRVSQVLAGFVPAGAAPQPTPAGLSHTRAQGDPVVTTTGAAIPYVVRAGVGFGTIRSSPKRRELPRYLPATGVYAYGPPPSIGPTGQAHTRAIGDPTVTATVGIPQVIRVVQPRRAGRTVQVSRVLAGFVPSGAPPQPTPQGLTHTRALGSPVVSPQVRPSGQAHTRAQGSLAVAQPAVRALGNLVVTVAWVERPGGLEHTRALGSPTVIGRKIEVAGLENERAQGTPILSGRALPEGLVHTRASSSPSVNPRTASPASLSRTRVQGSPVASLVKIGRPESLVHASRALGAPTAHGHMEVGPPSLDRSSEFRVLGAPTLSGRALPSGITHTRVLGTTAVNVRTLVPSALDRA
jgi:hypothetical protein